MRKILIGDFIFEYEIHAYFEHTFSTVKTVLEIDEYGVKKKSVKKSKNNLSSSLSCFITQSFYEYYLTNIKDDDFEDWIISNNYKITNKNEINLRRLYFIEQEGLKPLMKIKNKYVTGVLTYKNQIVNSSIQLSNKNLKLKDIRYLTLLSCYEKLDAESKIIFKKELEVKNLSHLLEDTINTFDTGNNLFNYLNKNE